MGDTTVHGTLVKPTGTGPFPAVIMAAGSGPTDRDWNSPLLPGTNGSAKLLAEALALAGFASLRYDKRVSGPHAMDNMRVLVGTVSMQSHVEEYACAVKLLAGRSEIRSDAIFGLGNSEGTLHVLNYQLKSPAVSLAGLILAAPPGRAVSSVVRSQLAAQAAAVANGEALLALYDEAIARFLAGQSAAPDPALPEGVRNLIAALEAPVNLPLARELWTADAASLLARIDVPLLVVIGKKDIQVDWQADGQTLVQAAQGKLNVTLVFPDNANHVLKYESQGRAVLEASAVMQRYNADDAQLDPETEATIMGWLARQMNTV
jgi:pimeloyl-ACP methyl ester carboxylesterase